MPYIRINTSRFSIIDIAASNIHRYYVVIVLYFVMRWPLLTGLQRQLFFWLRSVDVRAIIKIRALAANNFLLPWMRYANSVTNQKEYSEWRSIKEKQLQHALTNPLVILHEGVNDMLDTRHLTGVIKNILPHLQAKDQYCLAAEIVRDFSDQSKFEEVEIESSLVIEELDSADADLI